MAYYLRKFVLFIIINLRIFAIYLHFLSHYQTSETTQYLYYMVGLWPQNHMKILAHKKTPVFSFLQKPSRQYVLDLQSL